MPFRKHAILQTHSIFYPHLFLVELMLNSSKFFKETCSNSRQLCCVDFIPSIKILVEFIRAHYTNLKVNFIWVQKHLNFQINFQKMTSVYITLFMFIHNSSSENGQKTTASAPTVLENFSCNFDFRSWISSDGFWYKSSLFLFNISVTCYSKGNKVKFSRFYVTFI